MQILAMYFTDSAPRQAEQNAFFFYGYILEDIINLILLKAFLNEK